MSSHAKPGCSAIPSSNRRGTLQCSEIDCADLEKCFWPSSLPRPRDTNCTFGTAGHIFADTCRMILTNCQDLPAQWCCEMCGPGESGKAVFRGHPPRYLSYQTGAT